MEKENDQDIELTEVDENTEEDVDWKELALKNQGIAKRFKTQKEKIVKEFEEFKNKPVEKPKPEPEPDKPTKSSELDYGQKAFLKTYGISGADELSLVKSWSERTGDQIDVLVEDEIFNAKLKSLRDQKAAKETLKEMSNQRSNSPSSKSKVEFWLDKPFDEVPKELKQDVLNAKLQKEKEESKFTDQPVVLG